MRALDAFFVQMEDRHVALHIGAVAVFEGPAPSAAEVRERYAHVVAGSPHYRQVLRRAPFEVSRPQWGDAGEVELEYHVRRTAVPAPGDPTQLERLVGRLMSQPLDPDRPLWEAWAIEGLQDGRWALLTKVHHSVVDGLGGMALFGDLLDGGPAHRSTEAHTGPTLVRRLLDTARNAKGGAGAVLEAAGGATRLVSSLRPTAANSLVGALGTARRYRTLSVSLADVRTVRESLGGTVNDVVLAMVTRGFRELLLARGESAQANAVRCLVPVSTRAPAEAHLGANRISVLLVDLPVDSDDPVPAYRLLRTRIAALKTSGEAKAGGRGFAAVNLLPPPLVAVVMNLLRRVPQRVVTTVATNVPGPCAAQTLVGRRMLALYPYVPIAEGIRVAVAVTSYCDQLHFGVTCDWKGVPDADVFVAALADGLADLVKDASG